ncbi:MAG: DNA replication complex GINS family protein [Nanoarchaeota archaeon]|nr:DNA replication complex GINS family protein [Nanoarchaeota archaeon]
MEESSTITYELIYELVRKEKTSDDIQAISPDTYKKIVSYLRTKLEIYKLESAKETAEAENVKLQIQSARKLVKELYERRERKILQLAVNRSRTKSETVSTVGLLPEEIPIFEQTTLLLDQFRASLLLPVINAKSVEAQAPAEHVAAPAPKAPEPVKVQAVPSKPEQGQKKDLTIKFVGPVPRFRGFNLEIYGPFDEGDTATLPEPFAKLLIEKKRATLI